jgi:hypothetical protein
MQDVNSAFSDFFLLQSETNAASILLPDLSFRNSREG